MYVQSYFMSIGHSIFYFFIIVNEDYTVDPMTDIRLRSDPIAITVTLLRDGVVGEGPEDIILTLMQDIRTQPNDNQLLIYDTIRIVLKDNDSMYVDITTYL